MKKYQDSDFEQEEYYNEEPEETQEEIKEENKVDKQDGLVFSTLLKMVFC